MYEQGGQREGETQLEGDQHGETSRFGHEQSAGGRQSDAIDPLLPVNLEFRESTTPTASERAYGPYDARSGPAWGFVASPARKHADEVARTEYIYETAQRSADGILSSLVPAYLAAREQLDAAAVGELGGRMLAAFSLVHGAKSALEQMLRKAPRQSFPGPSVDEDLALARIQEAVEAKASLFDTRLSFLDKIVASTMTPHVFRGQEVAGYPVVVSLEVASGEHKVGKLAAELQRTLGMLVLVDDLKTSLLEGKDGLDKARLEIARGKLVPWASRPLDLAFLRAALGPIWDLLDASATGAMDTKPSALLDDAAEQTNHTGWLGDLGRFDIDNATIHLRAGGRAMAELVLGELYTADPDARACALMQIKERGLLDALCSAVGWTDIKQLHDSLGHGFSEIKTDLQHYFLGRRKYGPSLDREWESHDSSLHGLVGRLGGIGEALNLALDIGTFGFHSSYGTALDANSQGLTSATEASRAKMHAAGRTAVIAAISLLTGGLADKAVRGGATTASTLRGVGAGAAGGSAGAVSALGASDTYGNYVSGDLQGFSSPIEYMKAALLGGVVGGIAGGVTQGLSNRVRTTYLARASESPTPEVASGSPERFEYGVGSGGRRNEAPLTPAQLDEALTYARELGVPEEVIHVVDESNTSWGRIFGEERLHIGTDVAPSTSPRWHAATANSRISIKGALAHEVVGHRAASIAGRTHPELVLEEVQASIRAARFAPELTPIERLTLIRDAVERLHRAGYRVADVRETLWIGTP